MEQTQEENDTVTSLRSDYGHSLELPNLFNNLKNARRFAIDIGGSLAKLAYFTTTKRRTASVRENTETGACGSLYQVEDREEDVELLNFVKFETKYIASCFNFIQQNLMRHQAGAMSGKKIKVTGGGAFKYKELIESKLGCLIDKEDEMDCLVRGCNFLLHQFCDEAFTYERHSEAVFKFKVKQAPEIFPYLLVNIGSGVSILKVESDTKYCRVGGTSMGGGTFWGLGSLLTGIQSFDELLLISSHGNHKNVDLLVGDIYGGNSASYRLPPDLLACSFGKITRSNQDQPNRAADIAQSLLFFISNDIAQLASLQAQLHNVTKIYFGGFFIRGHPLTMRAISYAINFWSKGEIQALFLRHEGYLGAIGAFLKGGDEEDMENYSWGESYLGSSGLNSSIVHANTNMFEAFQISKHPCELVRFPLLAEPRDYQPDVDDLTQDAEARKYWLECFTKTLPKFTKVAVSSEPEADDKMARAEMFTNEYQTILSNLTTNPIAYGMLTVRGLLDMREQCLHNANFTDIYLNLKARENETSLEAFPSRIEQLEQLTGRARWSRLVEGVLAGNIFDWGAQAVAELLEAGQLDFNAALSKLQKRPWLADDLDKWLERISSGPMYKCVAVFCDNSGADILLGIIPLVRQLLMQGSTVILCANSEPVVNDVTYTELNILLSRLSPLDRVVSEALESGRLRVMESGQASPCLDLRFIDSRLCQLVEGSGTDLVIIEGMGRAVHTNYRTRFTCDSLKLAVIKNDWLARRLGGEMYSVICQFIQPCLD